MAPFLINKFGIELYGVIALANSLPSYIQVFTVGLSNSTTRFISISKEKGDFELANIYFYTSYKALLSFVSIIFPLILLFVFFTPFLFVLPNNFENESQFLFFLILISTIFNILHAPFGSVYQLYSKFLQKNIITIFSKLTSVLILYLLFYFFTPEIWYVGIYHIGTAVFSLVLLFLNYNKFQNIFQLKHKIFKISAFKQIGKLGFWNSVNDLAALFFLIMSQVLINQFMGNQQSGYFGPILLLFSLFVMGAGAISNVLMPLIYRDIANNNNNNLENRLLFFSKSLSYIIAIPLFIFVVFANDLIVLWLGYKFLYIVPTTQIILISLFFGGIIFIPYVHYYRGLNKIKVPAITNIAFGILNFILVITGFYFDLGLLGVAYSFSFTFGLRGIFFNLIYFSFITE
ncbi:hypothetical protein N9H31_01235, partial [bacterium]|nr:hypothetical protein [bacterium]